MQENDEAGSVHMPQAERQISFRAILTGNRADPSIRIASSGVGIHHCMDRRGLQPSSDPTPTCRLLRTEQPLRSNLNRKDKLSRNSGTPLIRIRFRVCRKCATAVLGGWWGGAGLRLAGAGLGMVCPGIRGSAYGGWEWVGLGGCWLPRERVWGRGLGVGGAAVSAGRGWELARTGGAESGCGRGLGRSCVPPPGVPGSAPPNVVFGVWIHLDYLGVVRGRVDSFLLYVYISNNLA